MKYLKNKLLWLLIGLLLLVIGQFSFELISLIGVIIMFPPIFLFVISGFIINPICQRKIKRIYKGLRRPLLQTPLCIKYFKNKGKYITKHIRFDESIITDETHINKIFGFTVGKLFKQSIHKNSFRFGWKIKNKKIFLMAYFYIDGERNYKELNELKLNTSYTMILHRNDSEIIFTVYETKDKVKEYTHKIKFISKEDYGYTCGLYYGGVPKAPHKIKIKIW